MTRFDSLSTGVKMLAILSVALLPLGIVALIASLQASRNAEEQRRSDLGIALVESTRKLGVELASDVAALRIATNAIALGGSPEETCARLSAVLAVHTDPPTPFALFGGSSAPLCNSRGFKPPRPSTIARGTGPRTMFEPEAMNMIVPASSGAAVAIVRYPATTLARFARPTQFANEAVMTLGDGTDSLPLARPERSFAPRIETRNGRVGLMGLTLSLSAPRPGFGATAALLAFLPLLMWASAATITFILVERLLIRPLRALRTAVSAHAINTPFEFSGSRTPAREIRDLAETFARSSRAIAAHQADLATALADQTRATREVHHRVKNNMQVVASLINLHARAAQSPEAAGAYATIQRRVDALSIVHRNHYAELDTDGGLDLRRLLGEIATNLRASTDPGGVATPISLTTSSVSVSQDIAIALAFLTTELIELSIGHDPSAPVTIAVEAMQESGRATLTIASNALRTTPGLEERLASRYARVTEGLARQLRSPLQRDTQFGHFSVQFATVPNKSQTA